MGSPGCSGEQKYNAIPNPGSSPGCAASFFCTFASRSAERLWFFCSVARPSLWSVIALVMLTSVSRMMSSCRRRDECDILPLIVAEWQSLELLPGLHQTAKKRKKKVVLQAVLGTITEQVLLEAPQQCTPCTGSARSLTA